MSRMQSTSPAEEGRRVEKVRMRLWGAQVADRADDDRVLGESQFVAQAEALVVRSPRERVDAVV